MWSNPAVQANRKTLEERGVRILGPGDGSQACGETGAGRMLDPDAIAEIVCDTQDAAIVGGHALQGKTVLVTVGPTHEPIDPVRYISNRSSGKMGYAIAAAALEQGAKVIVVSGPVSIAAPPGVDIHSVRTAQEMYRETHDHIDGVDIFIATAAVSDYRPANAAKQKIKKDGDSMRIDLVRSPDILASVAQLEDGPFTVGFAAETEKVREYALGKLGKKKLDMIVANRVGEDCGFGYDDNAVAVFWNGGEQAFAKTSKTELARQVVMLIAERYASTSAAGAQPKLSLISSNKTKS